LDGQTLDALLLVQRAATTSDRREKAGCLGELSMVLEALNLLWELAHNRKWISQQQLVFVTGRLAEAGRMTGGWLKQARGAGS
jgi:HEAT repeat protein